MMAYKFLGGGRVGPFSGYRWPEPGVWVRTAFDPAPCRSGIHACRIRDLPWWLGEELWLVELEGELHYEEHKIVAPAGRLHSRIDPWTAACAEEYAHACAWRTRDRALQALTGAGHAGNASELAHCATLDELLTVSRRLAHDVPDTRISLTIAGDGAVRALSAAAPTTAYIAAHAALRVGGQAAYAAERAWQARWLVERLDLPSAA
ncbi:MAG: hypothetical protein JO179_17470 [Solirubrobacterales bacterium]|nr:hypothetical protein [Solirubrobacterales bacterium]